MNTNADKGIVNNRILKNKCFFITKYKDIKITFFKITKKASIKKTE